jgi:hypothetical protein
LARPASARTQLATAPVSDDDDETPPLCDERELAERTDVNANAALSKKRASASAPRHLCDASMNASELRT